MEEKCSEFEIRLSIHEAITKGLRSSRGDESLFVLWRFDEARKSVTLWFTRFILNLMTWFGSETWTRKEDFETKKICLPKEINLEWKILDSRVSREENFVKSFKNQPWRSCIQWSQHVGTSHVTMPGSESADGQSQFPLPQEKFCSSPRRPSSKLQALKRSRLASSIPQ